MRQIESICLFKARIHPSWEDEQNQKGSQIQYNFGFLEKEVINGIWRKMIIDMVSGEIKYFDKVFLMFYCRSMESECWKSLCLVVKSRSNIGTMKISQKIKNRTTN